MNNEIETMMKFITGKWIAKPIFIVSKLGIPDILAEGPREISYLSAKTKTDENYLYRIMRALSSLRIFREKESSVFEQTPASSLLTSDKFADIAVLFNDEWNDKAWSRLYECMESKKIPFDEAHKKSLPEYLNDDSFAADIHDRANAIKISKDFSRVLNLYDFSEVKTVTDVGGGTGTLLAEILFENDFLTGYLAELPFVAEKAKVFFEGLKLEKRVKTIVCNYFERIPVSSDIYILSNVLHNLDDYKSSVVLGNLREAMEAESKILICEMIIPEANTSSVVPLLDLEMLVMTGGKERTKDEFKNLLSDCGFKTERFVETGSELFLIVAVLK